MHFKTIFVICAVLIVATGAKKSCLDLDTCSACVNDPECGWCAFSSGTNSRCLHLNDMADSTCANQGGEWLDDHCRISKSDFMFYLVGFGLSLVLLLLTILLFRCFDSRS
ncbi:hypothetical protein PCE1_003741 [Barthelona sp. PCE]